MLWVGQLVTNARHQELKPTTCELLVARALAWMKLHDPTKANPKVLPDTLKTGDLPRNVEGFQQSLVFAMYNDRGVWRISRHKQATCELAFDTLLCDCPRGGMANMGGGVYFSRHDDLVDPRCVHSQDKKCGANV